MTAFKDTSNLPGHSETKPRRSCWTWIAIGTRTITAGQAIVESEKHRCLLIDFALMFAERRCILIDMPTCRVWFGWFLLTWFTFLIDQMARTMVSNCCYCRFDPFANKKLVIQSYDREYPASQVFTQGVFVGIYGKTLPLLFWFFGLNGCWHPLLLVQIPTIGMSDWLWLVHCSSKRMVIHWHNC